jgi:hypothetical protein
VVAVQVAVVRNAFQERGVAVMQQRESLAADAMRWEAAPHHHAAAPTLAAAAMAPTGPCRAGSIPCPSSEHFRQAISLAKGGSGSSVV